MDILLTCFDSALLFLQYLPQHQAVDGGAVVFRSLSRSPSLSLSLSVCGDILFLSLAILSPSLRVCLGASNAPPSGGDITSY